MVVVALGVVLFGLAVAVVRDLWLTDSSEVVLVEEAVDRFRDETTEPGAVSNGESTPAPSTPGTSAPATPTPDAPQVALPEPGVYRYRTTGGESIDAMGGVTREYPGESAITVTPRGCGVHLSWDPLEERRDEWELCATGLVVGLQPRGVQFHEFFGQSQLDEIRCDGVVAVTTTGSTAEPATTRTCMLADDPWTPVWEILGRSTLQVGGRDVAVTHARMTVEDDDEYWEHTIADWYVADSGLPVSVSVDTSSRSPSFVGAVVYHETYTLELASMSPLT